MNSGEIDVMIGRVARFADRGLTLDEAEALADGLVIRDREDDRSACFECQHLGGSGPGSWRCGNWRRAGIARRVGDAGIGRDFASLMQRCDGFKPLCDGRSKEVPR